MNTIRIVAAVVDVRQLTLYKEDGSTLVIPQGDPRLRRMLEEATPQLQAQGWADIVLTLAEDNIYADFEEQSSGMVRFFRVAKSKLKTLLKQAEPVAIPPQVVGVLPVVTVTVAAAAPATPVAATPLSITSGGPNPSSWEDVLNFGRAAVVDSIGDALVNPLQEEGDALADAAAKATQNWEAEKMDGFNKDDDAQDDQEETFDPVEQVPLTKVEQTLSVVDEIIKHAIPVSSVEFNEDGIVKQRVLAVNGVTENSHPDDTNSDTIIAVVGNKVIPGMELIKTQFGRASKLGSTVGVEKFLKRLGTVIETRSHSVEDLLKFMERADLPIADDGSILIYKVLRRSGDDKYVDCHTRKVVQFVGAYVCMDPSLVDHNRSHECSNGLHVARRGYIRAFSGDVCVLAKLAPEDVITVPQYDANKMRVCGYHILKELTSNQYRLLSANRPITDDPDGKRLLAEAISGNHVGKTHEVRIKGSHGSDVVTTKYPQGSQPAPVMTADAPKEVDALSDANDATVIDSPIQPKDVERIVTEQLTRKDQAKVLHDAWLHAKGSVEEPEALAALIGFKKQAKVGWDRLGIPDPTVKPITTPPAGMRGTDFEKKKQAIAKVEAKVTKQAEAVKPPPAKKVLPAASEGSPRERIAKLMTIGLDSAGIAQKVYDIKKASKKAWVQLGVDDATAESILKAIGKE